MRTDLAPLPDPPLQVITDRRAARRPLADIVAAAIGAGCRWVMLREKDMPPQGRLRLTRQLLALAAPAEATVSVNGDLVAASLSGAVHLPQGRSVAEARATLGPDALVGVSCHSQAEAADAAAGGADYVTLSPVFATASKPGYGPVLGLGALADAVRTLPVPVVALGGVGAANAGDCLSAGAAGVAVMGAVMRAPGPGAATADLLTALRESRT